MKDQRFIELLNLYIDRQITAEETAQLEAEIQQHPKRQAVYRQYCQIHTATKVVYQSFRAGAAEQTAPTGRPASIEMFENRRRRANWAYYAAGVAAAAACAALAFVRTSASRQLEQPALTAVPHVAPVTVAAVAPAKASVAPVAPASAKLMPNAPAPNLISLRNAAASPDYSAMLVALREQDEERAIAAERWHAGRSQSLFDDNLFESRPATLSTPEDRSLRHQTAQQVEMTVFQFQR